MKGNKWGVLRSVRALLTRGAVYTLPIAVTVVAVKFVLELTDSWLGSAAEEFVRWLLPQSWLGPLATKNIPGLGIVFLLLFLLIVGGIASWKVGKSGLSLIERLLLSIPIARIIYSAARKIADIFGDRDDQAQRTRFQRVVFFEPYAPGVREPGLVVAEVIDQATGRKYLVVCIPSKPHPTGAAVMIVAEDKTTDAGMSPQELLKWGMSLGMLTPPQLPITGPKSGEGDKPSK